MEEFDIKILYDLAEIITNTAIKDINDYYDEIYKSIIEKATFENYLDLIDEKVNEFEKDLDKEMTTFFERYIDDIKDLLIDWGYDQEEIKGFIERQADTIFYMYEHDILFFTKENLEKDIEETLNNQNQAIIEQIDGLLSAKIGDCFYGTVYIYIDENNLDVKISKHNDLNFENYIFSGKITGYGMSGVEVNFKFKGAETTYYGCFDGFGGFDHQEDLYF
jgi:hypothetical protein